VKQAVQSPDVEACVRLVEEIKDMETPGAVFAACERVARERYPDLLCSGAKVSRSPPEARSPKTEASPRRKRAREAAQIR
jgi:hypothetical protein